MVTVSGLRADSDWRPTAEHSEAVVVSLYRNVRDLIEFIPLTDTDLTVFIAPGIRSL